MAGALLLWSPFECLPPKCLLTLSVLHAAELPSSSLPPSSLERGISWIRFPDSQAPSSQLPAAARGPGGDIHTKERPPTSLCEHSQAHSALGSAAQTRTWVSSLGHGEAWTQGRSQVSLAGGLRYSPQGQIVSSLSGTTEILPGRRQGEGSTGQRSRASRLSLCCWGLLRPSLQVAGPTH